MAQEHQGSIGLSLNPSRASTSHHGTAGDFKLRISKTRVKISFIFPKKITAAQVHDNGIQNIEIWIKDRIKLSCKESWNGLWPALNRIIT